MPGTIVGGFTGGFNTVLRRQDRWLNFVYAWPPESLIRDREDAPGSRNPYNPWSEGGAILGGEETGMAPVQITIFDDDIRYGGGKGGIYSIAGQCLDAGGSPMPGMTVELWMTSPNWDSANEPRLVATVTADAQGFYGFAVPNNTTTYMVIMYDGSRGGITQRNLVGT